MKGLELSKAFYEAYGKEMLEKDFPELLPFLAVGLAGSGSECYGFDDEASRDHDFEPAFCIFLPDEDIIDSKTEFKLERAYAKLPKEFMGFKRSPLNPVGGNRHGVIRTSDFFASKTGSPDGSLSLDAWFSVPEFSLLEATNGEIFSDPSGQFSAIRHKLKYFPESVRLKKLAGHLLLMGQAGQYNYERCLKRGDTAAAQLAIFEFSQSAMHCIFLLNRAYMPYYKWAFKMLKELPVLGKLAADLEYLISSGNEEKEAIKKQEMIEKICSKIAVELRKSGLTHLESSEMERLAYAINDTIPDPNVRNLNILYGV